MMMKYLGVLSLLIASASCVEQECSSDLCSLYLAPSSLPGAGLGVFTTVDISKGDTVGEPDLVVPVLDKFKALPYRGQQHFLSWLGYIWPEKAGHFYTASRKSEPSIPKAMYKVDHGLNKATRVKFYDENTEERISVFAPGIASLVNSSPDDANIKQSKDRMNEFVATQDIPAGSELLMNYGKKWHEAFQQKRNSSTEYETLDDYHKLYLPNVTLPTTKKKRKAMEDWDRPRLDIQLDTHDDKDENKKDDEEANEEAAKKETNEEAKEKVTEETKNEAKKEANEEAAKKEEAKEHAKDEDEDDEEEEYDEKTVGEQLEWLRENGACIDKIQAGETDSAGNGAFAKIDISKGSTISLTPLLTIKREDLVIYEADETQEVFRNVLNKDKVLGQEPLLNFCYGHPDSPLLLLPYSPIVNLINHNGKEPNAKIQWAVPTGQSWLDVHPLDVLDMSGTPMMEFVALRNIQAGEEVVIDYGHEWEEAWDDKKSEHEFRHEIGVPDGFYPETWKNQKVVYELARDEPPLKPGEVRQMTWAHNGKPVCKNCHRVGLPAGFSERQRKFADDRGILSLYDKLLNDKILNDDEITTIETKGEQWFVQAWHPTKWSFNMHYIGAWDEAARMSFLRGLGNTGFDTLLEGVGDAYGLDNLTCFHFSYMGISEADNSMTHADIWASEETGFNFIFPLVLVNGTDPELDVISDDANIVLSAHYEHDVAFALGDYAYHKTSPNSYESKGLTRVVVSLYCGQLDERTAPMYHYIYDDEHPAPFCDQFKPPYELHWSKDGQRLPK